MKTKLKPTGSRVLVKRCEAKEETASGILIPNVSQEKEQEGTVIAVGWSFSAHIEHVVKVGDRVLMPKYGGSEIKLNDEVFQLIDEVDILGVLTYEEDSKEEGDELDFGAPLGARQADACADDVCESCT